MDKNAIKKYAVWARNELIVRVSQRAQRYGITKDQIVDANAGSVNGIILTDTEKKQRQALIQKIREKGFEQMMEEVAYTWFNRFSALRFMEVNGYLPSHVRVFTDQNNAFKPEIMAEAIHLDLDGLDMEKVYALKEANNDDELFKYLIITQCNDLNRILPGMFQKIADYTELLFPDNLLREGSVIEQMIALIPEEDWKDQVQIIGWLYQYYNSEPKDQVFADLKKNKKITKEKIPAATQLFTPDWIVRYMVENSLGRLWVEGHPNDELKSQWKYYLDEAEQEPDVQKQLTEIRKEYSALKPEEIKCIDPCCGSGHILAYMFDVLIQIYGAYGISARDAAASIVKNNIYGLDIDDRAAQLAQFFVMMKARQYDRRFFSRAIQSHVYAIEESNGITSAPMHDMGIELSHEEYSRAVKQAMCLVEEFQDAKEYGSAINVTPNDWTLLRKFAVPRTDGNQLRLDIHGEVLASEKLQRIINVGEMLSSKYDVVITNPPYMGGNGMGSKLSSFVKANYPATKYDMSTVFMEKTLSLCKINGFMSMINIPVWMFLSSFEDLRIQLISSRQFISLMHMGRGVFGADFGTTTFVLRTSNIEGYVGTFRKLYERQGTVDDLDKKLELFNSGYGTYRIRQSRFNEVPGHCIAYSASDALLNDFEIGKRFDSFSDAKQGLATADNNRFLRYWHEVELGNVFLGCKSHEEAKKSNKKWFPYNKGGGYCKWYGNNSYLINWQHDGQELKAFKGSVIRSPQYYFRQCLSWCKVTISGFSMRYIPEGFLFDVAGCSLFVNDDRELYTLGFANSNVNSKILSIISPTVNYEVGQISSLPLIENIENKKTIENLVSDNISLCKNDWDSSETSWDFVRHPMVSGFDSAEDAYLAYKHEENGAFYNLKSNEEEINEEFIRIYGLDNELSPEVKMRDITIHYIVDKREDVPEELQGSAYIYTREDVIKSLISYAVGCMFGRYSLDEDNLIYAGGEWDSSKYRTYKADKDNIIPVCDDEYFEDDILGRFIEFLRVAFGERKLEENLRFIADTLGGKGTPREVIRNYFINDFYTDHLKTYQKRPIYWLFDSGKKNGFKCLIYMHRYQPDTIARIRTDYVHEQQSRYRTAIADLEQRIESASTGDRVKLNKKLKHLQEQSAEIHDYEEKIHHLADQYISIDLDDGVKANYAKFQDVLAKIK